MIPGAVLLVALLAACTPGSTAGSTPTGSAAPSSVAALPTLPPRPVTHGTLWLCKPGMADNPCEGGLDATVVGGPDSGSVEPFTTATDPVADCFYVYPTVSEAPGTSAPLEVTEAEVRTVRAQAARFTESCRLFAPIYRQITRAGLSRGGLADAGARDLAYDDVLSAFNDYLNTENRGRPVVLIGHSQGTIMLTRLLQEQVDGDPALRGRVLSALLIGGVVQTLPDEPDGGTFANLPACRSAQESGCVVAYSTYAGKPPSNGIFGRSTPTRQATCVSPAALLGRGDALTAYLPTAEIMGGEPKVAGAPATGFVTLPGRVTGECRSTDDFTWLDVSVDRDELENLPNLDAGSDPAWGLHRADVSLALGDLVDLVAAQSAAWAARGGPSEKVS
jgi:hypothetical protein